MSHEDQTSNDEAGARDHAAHLGRTEDFGGGVGDQDPSPFDGRDARLRPDPWGEHVCPACGERETPMPETCRNCHWRNYGSAS
jgi:hypothetical protein